MVVGLAPWWMAKTERIFFLTQGDALPARPMDLALLRELPF
jgi:hypothetical protein